MSYFSETNGTILNIGSSTLYNAILGLGGSRPTWQASALVGMVTGLPTRAAVEALGGRAGQRGHLARAPAVARRALAAVGAVGVEAEAAVEARARLAALVDVVAAVLSLEARWAGAVVVVIPVGTAGAVGTGTGGTGVNEGAVLAWRGRKRERAKKKKGGC